MEFKPTHKIIVSNTQELRVQILREDYCVRSAFYDLQGNRISRVSESRIRTTMKGHPNFIRSRDYYYLSELSPLTKNFSKTH